MWVGGGDFNSATKQQQPTFAGSDFIDMHEPVPWVPPRFSADQRKVSAHGRRLLAALTNAAIILNGLEQYEFDGEYTRMPTREQDCPGVLDYIIGPPSLLTHVVHNSLKVVSTPADFSDHSLLSLSLAFNISCVPNEETCQSDLFCSKRLHCIKLPQDDHTWKEIDEELADSCEFQDIYHKLQTHSSDRKVLCSSRAHY